MKRFSTLASFVVSILLLYSCSKEGPEAFKLTYSKQTVGGKLFAFQNGLVEVQPNSTDGTTYFYQLPYQGTYLYVVNGTEKYLALTGNSAKLDSMGYHPSDPVLYQQALNYLTVFDFKPKHNALKIDSLEQDYSQALDQLSRGILPEKAASLFPKDPVLANIRPYLNRAGSWSKLSGYSFSNSRGEQVDLNSLNLKQPVLLDFWASWCKPCRMQNTWFRSLLTIRPELQQHLLQINLDETEKLFQKSAQQDGIFWNSVRVSDADRDQLGTSLGIYQLPSAFIARDSMGRLLQDSLAVHYFKGL